MSITLSQTRPRQTSICRVKRHSPGAGVRTMKRARNLEAASAPYVPNYDVISELSELGTEYRSCVAEEAAAIAGSKMRLYGWLKAIFTVIDQLRTDDKAWQVFTEAAVWEDLGSRPSMKDRVRPERPVLHLAMVPQTRRDHQLLSKYAAALEELAVRQTPVAKFIRAIEDAGGIEALARLAAVRRGGGRRANDLTAVRLHCRAPGRSALESLEDGAILSCEIKAVRAKRGARFVLLDSTLNPLE